MSSDKFQTESRVRHLEGEVETKSLQVEKLTKELGEVSTSRVRHLEALRGGSGEENLIRFRWRGLVMLRTCSNSGLGGGGGG